jgi:hypothetical protein
MSDVATGYLASDGRKWNVAGYPTRDMNAFTGWQSDTGMQP